MTEAPPVDLTPRPTPPRRGGRGWVAWAVGAAVALAIGFAIFQGLSNATVFFYNVDEAVAKRPETGDRRIRIQGDVVPGTVEKLDQGVRFDVRFNGVVVGVDNSSDPPDLFGPTIPIVIEGRWKGDRFAGDKILVKHDEKYTEENSDRLECAERAAEASSAGQSGSAGATAGGASATVPCPVTPSP